jgi:hypothetical protein
MFIMTDHALDSIPKTYDAAVRALAAAHGGANIAIYSMADPAQQVVRLIEVSADFPAAGVERPIPPDGKEWIVPVFPMGRARDFPFRSEIAQVTPAEWDKLRQGKLKLNRDWGDLNTAQRIENGN